MGYVNGTKSATIYNPEFFRLTAIAYNNNPTDRAQWLKGQIINLQAGIYQYQVAIQDLMRQGAQLDGKSDAATWMQGIGAVAVVIPNVWVKVAGAVVSIAGSIVAAAERKKDSKALQQLSFQAAAIQLEAGQLQKYYEQYENELNIKTYAPVALFVAAAYLMYKK